MQRLCGPSTHPTGSHPSPFCCKRGTLQARVFFLLASEPLLSVYSRRRPLQGVNRVLNLFLNFIMQFVKFSV